MSRPTHYIAGSGMRGCLYDSCEVFKTKAEAVDYLVEMFELGRVRRDVLLKHNFLYLELTPVERREGKSFGADYCEIVPCSCARPEVHSDSGLD